MIIDYKMIGMVKYFSSSDHSFLEIVPLLERYARIYDGALNSNQMTLKSKSYYWVVSSEVALYVNQDFDKTSHCLMKAAEFNEENIEWRIVLSKLLLESFKNIINHEDAPAKIRPTLEVYLSDRLYPEVTFVMKFHNFFRI